MDDQIKKGNQAQYEIFKQLLPNIKYWNYRVLAHEYNNCIELEVHEVYYNLEDRPVSYIDNVNLTGDNIKEIKTSIKLIEKAFSKPILWHGEKFPQEYTPQND